MGVRMAIFNQERKLKSGFLNPRMLRGIPDSELPPLLVLTLKFGFRAASEARRVEVLPAEPVMPTIFNLGFNNFILKSCSRAKRRR